MQEYVKVFISSESIGLHNLAFLVIEQLLKICGWKCKKVNDIADADIAYTFGKLDFSTNAWVIPSVSLNCWREIYKSQPINFKNHVIPDCCIIQYELNNFDIILASHFFLSGIYEKNPNNINEIGIPNENSKVWGIQNTPVVNVCIQFLKTYLSKLTTLFPPKPLWPNNKKWAVVLTHDCDQPFRFRSSSFIRESIRNYNNKNYSNSFKEFTKFIYSSFSSTIIKDPYFNSWIEWMNIEKSKDIKSTFFVASRNRFDKNSDPRDVPYCIQNKKISNLVKDLYNSGWDIGLHASINAYSSLELIGEEIDKFKKTFGFLPLGIRSHFWSIGLNTFNSISNFSTQSSIIYDSSLGIDNYPGFRRGVVYPFHLYNDIEFNRIIEVPPTIMDWGLFNSSITNSGRAQILKEYIQKVKIHNGVLVLDWHDYTLNKYVMDDLGSCVFQIISDIIEDSDCYFANASELADWCINKRWLI
jgi:hypothetical protein